MTLRFIRCFAGRTARCTFEANEQKLPRHCKPDFLAAGVVVAAILDHTSPRFNCYFQCATTRLLPRGRERIARRFASVVEPLAGKRRCDLRRLALLRRLFVTVGYLQQPEVFERLSDEL